MPAPAYNEMEAYIRQQAALRHIDPDVAVRVAQAEALNVFDPTKPDMGGDDHSSFGLYQLHYGGLSKAMPNPGLGDEFTRVTGLDARDPSTWRQQVNFSLDHASRNGWGAWMGAKNTGIGAFEGISGASKRVSGPVEAAGGGAGADIGAPTLYSAPSASPYAVAGTENQPSAPLQERRSTLADDFALRLPIQGPGFPCLGIGAGATADALVGVSDHLDGGGTAGGHRHREVSQDALRLSSSVAATTP